MASVDIREIKKGLREEIKAFRRALAPEQKGRLDRRIAHHVLRMHQFRACKTILLYMSTPIEVDTKTIIKVALEQKKQVALPRCVDGTRHMEFYLIRSLSDLEKGTFGVLEPKTSLQKLSDFRESICVVPALSYDRQGFRLGYGGGYYDRFLGQYPGFCVGMVYGQNLRDRLPHGRFDRPVGMIVTERGFFYPTKPRFRPPPQRP